MPNGLKNICHTCQSEFAFSYAHLQLQLNKLRDAVFPTIFFQVSSPLLICHVPSDNSECRFLSQPLTPSFCLCTQTHALSPSPRVHLTPAAKTVSHVHLAPAASPLPATAPGPYSLLPAPVPCAHATVCNANYAHMTGDPAHVRAHKIGKTINLTVPLITGPQGQRSESHNLPAKAPALSAALCVEIHQLHAVAPHRCRTVVLHVKDPYTCLPLLISVALLRIGELCKKQREK